MKRVIVVGGVRVAVEVQSGDPAAAAVLLDHIEATVRGLAPLFPMAEPPCRGCGSPENVD